LLMSLTIIEPGPRRPDASAPGIGAALTRNYKLH
jgi:hypothetical protein